jgi:hypothetical protein
MQLMWHLHYSHTTMRSTESGTRLCSQDLIGLLRDGEVSQRSAVASHSTALRQQKGMALWQRFVLQVQILFPPMRILSRFPLDWPVFKTSVDILFILDRCDGAIERWCRQGSDMIWRSKKAQGGRASVVSCNNLQQDDLQVRFLPFCQFISRMPNTSPSHVVFQIKP